MANDRFNKRPYFGRGIGFPFRLNPVTGGVLMTEGSTDHLRVALEFLRERFSFRESGPEYPDNHIAEAITHILLTRRGEHDTLPEFGSKIDTILHDPNIDLVRKQFETWVELAVARWEKRASIPMPAGVVWNVDADRIDRNELACKLLAEFLSSQVDGNLVSPFVEPREARSQEYPVGQPDLLSHDWASRYRGIQAFEVDGQRFIRQRQVMPLSPRSDDLFYEVKGSDTWLLISWQLYGDIRFHWAVTDMYVQDMAEAGAATDVMDTTALPDAGTVIRCPSRTRLLMEMAA
jgi:phage baseplate assembly protein W